MCEGLLALMDFYCPALLLLGTEVRSLTWEGAVGGTVKGDKARRVLEVCLGLQVHITQDLMAKSEYTRSLSVALLAWQPWFNDLPGCCFCEEPGEAMLSRLVGRCVANPNVTAFGDVEMLFVSLSETEAMAQPTPGGLRKSLVYMMVSRVRRFLRLPTAMLFPKLRNVKEGVWHAVVPRGFKMPAAMTEADTRSSLQGVLLSALTTLVGRRPATQAVIDQANRMLPLREDDSDLEVLEETQKMIFSKHSQLRRPPSAQQPATRPRLPVARRTPATTEVDQPEATPPRPAATAAQPQLPDTSDSRAEEPSQVGEQAESVASGSLYDPIDQFSEGHQSYADSDGLGSMGEPAEGPAARWSTLEDDWVEDPGHDPFAHWCPPPCPCCVVTPVTL